MDVLVFGAALVALIGAERAPRLRFQRSSFFRRFFLTDLWYLATGAILLSKIMQGFAISWTGIFGVRGVLERAPFAVTVSGAVVLHDLGGYASHVMLHRVDRLWALHKVHHSSLTLDWLATFRAHIVEHALRHILSPVLLILIGFPLGSVAIASVVLAVWAAFVHSNLAVSWRWAEPLFITPRLHRLHHVPATSHMNLGVMFSIWDRLLGRLDTSSTARLNPTGVIDEVETYPQTWLKQLIKPFSPFRVSVASADAAAT